MLMPKPENPATFSKICFRVNDARQLAKCETQEAVRSLVNEFFRAIQIKSMVFQWSKIGNSILEIIVPDEEVAECLFKIRKFKMDILDNPRLWEAPAHHVGPSNSEEKFVKRVAYQVVKSRLLKIKECLLENIPGHIQALINDEVRRIKETRSEATATALSLAGSSSDMDVTSCL